MRHAHESIAKSIASTRLAAPKRIVVGWRRSLGKGLSFRYYLRTTCIELEGRVYIGMWKGSSRTLRKSLFLGNFQFSLFVLVPILT